MVACCPVRVGFRACPNIAIVVTAYVKCVQAGLSGDEIAMITQYPGRTYDIDVLRNIAGDYRFIVAVKICNAIGLKVSLVGTVISMVV